MKIKFAEREYNLPITLWDITISQAKHISELWEKAPESVIKRIKGADVEVWSSDLEKEDEIMLDTISFLTGIDRDMLSRTSHETIELVARLLHREIIFPILTSLAPVEGIEKFEFRDNTYLLPLYDLDVSGQTMPLSNETAMTWSEAADLMTAQKDSFKYMALIIAILCRKEGEKYDERVAKRRAVEFEELPAQIMFEVFFCLSNLAIIWSQNSLIASRAAELRRRRETVS